MDQLYREATEDETDKFLHNSFIALKHDFSLRQVKTANRKRIALASDTLSRLQEPEREQIFSYTKEYCPQLKYTDDAFEIKDEEDLKMLLYGIEQRFYKADKGEENAAASDDINNIYVRRAFVLGRCFTNFSLILHSVLQGSW